MVVRVMNWRKWQVSGCLLRQDQIGWIKASDQNHFFDVNWVIIEVEKWIGMWVGREESINQKTLIFYEWSRYFYIWPNFLILNLQPHFNHRFTAGVFSSTKWVLLCHFRTAEYLWHSFCSPASLQLAGYSFCPFLLQRFSNLLIRFLHVLASLHFHISSPS